ncbi:MAG: hypothetical protein ABIN69_06705 [Aestuariivirga sp.]
MSAQALVALIVRGKADAASAIEPMRMKARRRETGLLIVIGFSQGLAVTRGKLGVGILFLGSLTIG